VVAATLEVARSDRSAGLVTSERRQYFDILGRPIGKSVVVAGVRRGPLEDVRVVFREALPAEQAVYQVQVNPLMSAAWLACGLLVLAGVIRLLEMGE
jgi:hypothetical protein